MSYSVSASASCSPRSLGANLIAARYSCSALAQQMLLPISRGESQVRRTRFTQQLLRIFRLFAGFLRMTQLQIAERQAQMCNAVVRSQLQSSIEVLRCLLGVLHVVQHISAVDIRFHHLRIALDGWVVIIDGFIQQLRNVCARALR